MHLRLHENLPDTRLMRSILAVIPSIIIAIGYPDFSYTYQLTIASFTISVALWFLGKSEDPYGLFHLSLNKLPGDSPETSPRTEWLNMGYWKARDCRLHWLQH
jgi:hypothetical protein